MPHFSAKAELYRTEVRLTRFGQKNSPGPRYPRPGPFLELVKTVMAEREPDRLIYSITVPLEAGFGKTELYYNDIEAISKRSDFPRA